MSGKTIKSKKRVRDYGEVFTPEWLASNMCDLCEPDISDPYKAVLEPSCGNGNFLIEILRRKISKCNNDNEILIACKNVFGVDLLSDNIKECHSRLLGILPLNLWSEASNIFKKNVIQGDFLKPETIWFLSENEW